jgi:hypothetical protein
LNIESGRSAFGAVRPPARNETHCDSGRLFEYRKYHTLPHFVFISEIGCPSLERLFRLRAVQPLFENPSSIYC